MSHKTYSIKRWDAVLFGNNEYPTPIIYVEPEENLLEFAKINEDALLVSIKSTNSKYENKKIPGIFASSSEIPNCRPVFFNKTKLSVIVLDCEWIGYPQLLGSCEIYVLKGGVPIKEINNVPLEIPTPSIESYTSTDNTPRECGMKLAHLIASSVTILVILLAVLFLLKK